jgi:single-strand DNA-binding protein
MSVNKVILIGNLGADPEVKYLDGNKVVAKISLATSESYKDKDGQKITQTEWHSLELWDELAKFSEKFLTKGREIYVEGKIKTDQWMDKDGNNRYSTKIRVNTLTLLRGGDPTSGTENASNPSPEREKSKFSDKSNTENMNDDLPF